MKTVDFTTTFGDTELLGILESSLFAFLSYMKWREKSNSSTEMTVGRTTAHPGVTFYLPWVESHTHQSGWWRGSHDDQHCITTCPLSQHGWWGDMAENPSWRCICSSSSFFFWVWHYSPQLCGFLFTKRSKGHLSLLLSFAFMATGCRSWQLWVFPSFKAIYYNISTIKLTHPFGPQLYQLYPPGGPWVWIWLPVLLFSFCTTEKDFYFRKASSTCCTWRHISNATEDSTCLLTVNKMLPLNLMKSVLKHRQAWCMTCRCKGPWYLLSFWVCYKNNFGYKCLHSTDFTSKAASLPSNPNESVNTHAQTAFLISPVILKGQGLYLRFTLIGNDSATIQTKLQCPKNTYTSWIGWEIPFTCICNKGLGLQQINTVVY